MTNQLYPAFFRLDRLQLLVVGAGEVGEEKLKFILKSSPNARVIIVAPWMGEELKELLESYQRDAFRKELANASSKGKQAATDQYLKNDGSYQLDIDKLTKLGQVNFHDTSYTFEEGHDIGGLYYTTEGGSVMWLKREFQVSDVLIADLIVAATNFKDVNLAVWQAAKDARRLTNIADTPSLCDFYLGSIVTRGPLKVAISTNGQSPTFAKRFRQFLEAELPEFETTTLLENLKLFRDRLTGDFQTKVRELNQVTSNLLASTTGDQPVHRCPPGGCLVAAAARQDGTRPTTFAPATAPSSGKSDAIDPATPSK